MPQYDINNASYSDVANNIEDFTVDSQVLDSPGEDKETSYINTDWNKQLGYYKEIPELQVAIDAKATWTVGKGYRSDEYTGYLLDNIKGIGNDTFNTIIENLIRQYQIGGDAFAEIIRNKKGFVINLKPLNPGNMKIIANKKGKIIRYEQINKGKPIEFKPEEILHLSRNRVGDEIHGVSLIDAVEWILLARNEAMRDWKRVLHRNVEPLWIFKLGTDDETEIANIISKYNTVRKDGENMFIPKDVVEVEGVSVASNATLSPLEWIDRLNKYFFQATGVPDIIVGGGASASLTEASAKIAYLAYQQTIEEEQLYIEEQMLSQLGLYIELEFPASLDNEMLSNKPKVENRGLETGDNAMQPNDTTANMRGNT